MTKFTAHNSVARRYLKRGELIAKRRAEAAQNALERVNDMHRVDRATSLGSLRDKPVQQIERNAEKLERRNRSIWYRDTNPLGNKIHAVQRRRGKSISFI